MNELLIIYSVWNCFVFFIYGWDKYKAKHHQYRISEFTLLCYMFFFGALGAILGMLCFHHKTKKRKFQIMAVFSAILQLSLCWLIIQ
ncbi:DUF1294 domain-containing protein [Absiella sp. AM54-8XD]|uniref:DUF1294 domain-containing protein n=1 Tax=unclassified Amedibacterium TaxID=3088137 RepID=UPI000E405DBE|nr:MULTISPECIES: DUF1294 domain-containing protein [unclassified Absiella]RGC20428.1 DUF1294 domain-containing protein [Absiella sp. AM54-8XD]RGC54006.1 DUF1294 domain-containing protein [Absiella sp. AM29-15]